MTFDEMVQSIREGRFLADAHLQNRLDRYGLTIDDVITIVTDGVAEIIEDYPEDVRGHSCLILVGGLQISVRGGVDEVPELLRRRV